MGVAEQVFGGRVAAEGDADAGRDAEARPEALELDGLVQRLDDPPGERVQAHAAGGRFDEHDELVAAVAPDGVVRTDDRAQPFADGLQELVAGLAAELVVDVLEPVDVDEQRARP